MDNTDPELNFDHEGVCHHCREFEARAKLYWFPNELGATKLNEMVAQLKKAGATKEYDAIIGLSGGVDSSYLAYWGSKHANLRLLAVHVDAGWNSELAVKNIEHIVKKLGIDLVTYVVNWDEMRDLQLAFFKAGVANQDTLQDHVFAAALYHYARKKGIKVILNGSNLATEGILPRSWGHSAMDRDQILAIHKRFGSCRLKTFPLMSFFDYYIYYPYICGIKTVYPLNYMVYTKEQAMKILQEQLGWQYYGGKHYESRFTKFFQAYWLPHKFGYDKRKAHLSSLIVSGQMSRETALIEMQKELYPVEQLLEDKELVCKKLGISVLEFDGLMAEPNKSFRDYPNNEWKVKLLIKAVKIKTLLRGAFVIARNAMTGPVGPAGAAIAPRNALNGFDGVIVLSFSDWMSELRTNRYIYTIRFARHLPVLFIQSTIEKNDKICNIVKAQENIYILKISKNLSYNHFDLLDKKIKEIGFNAPLFWIYNYQLVAFVSRYKSFFKIVHATEDYYSSFFNLSELDMLKFKKMIELSDRVVCVSKEIRDKISQDVADKQKVILIENGCDHSFWSRPKQDVAFLSTKKYLKNVVYQGSISKKIDFELIEYLVKELPDHAFHFVGPEVDKNQRWPSILKNKNFFFYGKRTPEFVRDLCHKCEVALVPFTRDPVFVKSSYPLKVFEYIAAGLPVVSIPLLQLQQYNDVIQFCDSYRAFKTAIVTAAKNDGKSNLRANYAKAHDYDEKFIMLISMINQRDDLKITPSAMSEAETCYLSQNHISHIKTVDDPMKRILRKLIFLVIDHIPPRMGSQLKYLLLAMAKKLQLRTY